MFRRVFHALEFLFRRRRMEEELDEELRSSLEMMVERWTAEGLPEAEARRRARLEFEGLEQVKERVRDSLAGSAAAGFARDLVQAWRALRRRPGFAAVALVTLALGIGANTAVFSVFHAVLLRPLPYARPKELVIVWASFNVAGTARAPVSGVILGEVARRNRAFSGVAGVWTLTRTFPGDPPEQVKHARVTSNFFEVLGVRAADGRTFTREDTPGAETLIADGFFRRRFAGDRSLIGKGMPMNGSNTLIGVLPPDFQLYFAPDANIPNDVQSFDAFPDRVWAERGEYYIRIVARMRPGVSIDEAQKDMDRVAAEIRSAYNVYGHQHLRFRVSGLQADSVREVHAALTALFAGAAFLLLICWVNITSLLVARASDRGREMALRLSLGASRGRIVRQLLAEGLVLGAIGGAAGVALGWAGFRGLLAIRPERLARLGGAGLDGPVLAFAAACSLAAALIFGLAPAVETFRLDPVRMLRGSGGGWPGRWQRRAGAMLVAGEIALGFLLVVGAALAARTLVQIERARPGFEARQLLTFQTAFPGPHISDLAQFEARLAGVPGVQSVGSISHLPLDKDIPNWYGPFRLPGAAEARQAGLVSDLRCVTPGYFATMGTRLLAGRYFDARDGAGARPVAIVDEMLARATWPGESPIGKIVEAQHSGPDGFEPRASEVVGEVEHEYHHSLTEPVRGFIYMPCEQSPRSPLTFVLRTSTPPLAVVPDVRAKLREWNRSAAMAKVRPMTAYVAREIQPAGFTALLAGIFAALAVLLAATGTFGVLNYQVSRRLPEMGIRMAVGADGGDVLRLILREGLSVALVGVALGAGGAVIAARWLGAVVYEVSPRDPLSYAVALVLLLAAALLGCWRPAARAAGSSPAEIIRAD